MKTENMKCWELLLVVEPPMSMEARAYLDHHVSQEEDRIQLTKIVCTLLRSALLCKQWFGSHYSLSAASQGGRDASQLSGEEGKGEGMFPFWNHLPSVFPELGCQEGRREGMRQLLNSEEGASPAQPLTQGVCGGRVPGTLWPVGGA